MILPDHLTPDERAAIEQAVREVAAKFPTQVRFIAIFGSKARGDFGPDSDIDMLIISESDDWRLHDQIGIPIYDANIDYTVLISVKIIGWERFQKLPDLRPGFFANLCRDAIELWRRPGTQNPLHVETKSQPAPVAA